MNPERFQSFAEQYATAVRAAVGAMQVHTGAQSADEFALDAALTMLEAIRTDGPGAVLHYALNKQGGALRTACASLGTSPAGLQSYLEG